MNSAVAITMELDDIETAAEELLTGINEKLTLKKNSIGILYYDYEMNGEELCLILQRRLSINIVGCTALAALEGDCGYLEMSAVLTVLSADDCCFEAVLSEPLNEGNALSGTHNAYNKARASLTQNPGLIFAIPPCSSEVIIDEYVDYLDDVSGSVPIIGGIPSSPHEEDRKILFNGGIYRDRLALLLIAGNIKPVFSIKNVITSFTEKKCVITRAEGAYVYEVNNGVPFLEYMKKFGLGTSELIGDVERIFFQTHPMLIENADNSEETPYVRILNNFNAETGSASSFARMPQDAIMTVAVLRQEDIGESARLGVEEIVNKIEKNQEDGYEYSTIICVTCSARHLVLTPYKDVEGNIIKSALPKNLNLSGFYSYGELAPIFYNGEKAKNCAHNASIAFCAF